MVDRPPSAGRPSVEAIVAPYFNAFNNGLGIAYLHLGAKYVEFGLLKQPINDPYLSRGRRRFLSAIDLAINSRMVGLGPVALDENIPNLNQNGTKAVDGAVQIEGKVYPGSRERWLPHVGCGRSRLQACLRHATHSYFHFVVLDTLLILLRHFGPDTVGNPNGHPNALSIFVSSKPYILFPRYYPLHPPPWVIEVIAEFSLAVGLWQGISWGYHFFALCAVGSGLWETESWEVDMFDAPWNADSLLDLWGRRWHQVSGVRRSPNLADDAALLTSCSASVSLVLPLSNP